MAKFNPSWFSGTNRDKWLDMLNNGNQTEQQRSTVGGIYRPEGSPAGGYAMPNPTVTPHTGYTEDKDGKRTGVGGGRVIRKDIPQAELIMARPDLQNVNKDVYNFWQQRKSSPENFKKVTPVTNQLSAALRSGGES